MIEEQTADFAGRYGPWALVAGASEGVGAAFARRVAERGINVVLLARRQHALDQVGASIAAATGVDVRAVAVDLADDQAMASITAATQDLEVGLLMYCAGADSNYRHFLAEPVDSALAMVARNCTRPVELCHHFAGPMAARGAGGIVLLSSGGGLIGAPNMVAYGATKAFDMVMAEALWAELHDQGVDVLGLVLGLTDTPALRRLMVQRGQLASLDDPVPGAASAEAVAADAIANLANGPTWLAGDDVRLGFEHLGAMPRNDAVRLMIDVAGASMGTDTPEEADSVTTPAIGIADRMDIADVLVRYATGIDRRDWALLRTCFTTDCVADYGEIGVWHGADEITAWMTEAHQDAGHTLHRITNPAVVAIEGGATARCYVDAIVMGADNRAGVRAVGFYDDELIRTDHGWQIHHRRFTAVFFQGVDPSATS